MCAQGDDAVRRPGSGRASAVKPTQAKAITRAHEIAPNAAVLVDGSAIPIGDIQINGASRDGSLGHLGAQIA
jgi:hypothetical protein